MKAFRSGRKHQSKSVLSSACILTTMWTPRLFLGFVGGVIFMLLLRVWNAGFGHPSLVTIKTKHTIQLWVEPFFFESAFFSNTLTELVPKTCDLRFEIKFRPFKDDGVSKSIILGVFGLRDDERQDALKASSRIGFIHLSDEYVNHDVSFYNRFAFVFRNYLRPESSLDYLKHTQSCTKYVRRSGNVFWLPLGYGIQFHSSPMFIQPLSTRPLLFSWIGSTHGKPSRSKMLDAIKQHENATFLYGNSMIRDTHSFNNEKEMLKGMGYSAYVYMSKFIPCPEGGNPDQFRIYESLEAGAIPIVQRGHKTLDYLKELDLEVLYVDKWEQLPEKLLQLSEMDAEKLDAWQKRLYAQWQLVRYRMQSFFACTLCEFAKSK